MASFGEYLRALRLERGKLNPPKEDEPFYEDLVRVLELESDDSRVQKLKDMASEERLREVSNELSDYAKEAELIPVLLRTVSNKKLSKDQISQLIEEIKANY